ncbi:MAG: helix-turn-helix transcriptional regulator, partial [Oscillospiraceae bacterium]|nr:helix-turn-helix transcriptional regulator [Oscillospiraceae bacterium]
CRYEQGKREPTASVLENIADYYNVSVDYLLGRRNRRK